MLFRSDDVEEIRNVLRAEHDSELVYCSLESLPNKPAHFVAVKKPRGSGSSSSELEVLLVVRGTKHATDVITDLLCDAAPYRGGDAHSGILESGRWIAERHLNLLGSLGVGSKGKKRRKSDNKRRNFMVLTLLDSGWVGLYTQYHR